MNGQVLPLFSTPVYIDTFDLTDTMVKDVVETDWYYLNEVDPQNYNVEKNGGMSKNTQWLQSHPEHQQIAEQYLWHYLTKVLGIGMHRHTLCHQSSWVNIHEKDDQGAGHSHTNAMFSGVMYYKIPENSGEILFHIPSMFPTYVTQTVLPDIEESNIYNMREAVIQPVDGMIILFPSHLPHTVNVNNSDEKRYSMAFNYYLKGAFGWDDTVLTL